MSKSKIEELKKGIITTYDAIDALMIMASEETKKDLEAIKRTLQYNTGVSPK